MTSNQPLLGVNIDHIATLRQARGVAYPDPVAGALICEQAGADGITLHLREDRRHIQDDDVYRLAKVITTRMNLEMAVTDYCLQHDQVKISHEISRIKTAVTHAHQAKASLLVNK